MDKLKGKGISERVKDKGRGSCMIVEKGAIWGSGKKNIR